MLLFQLRKCFIHIFRLFNCQGSFQSYLKCYLFLYSDCTMYMRITLKPQISYGNKLRNFWRLSISTWWCPNHQSSVIIQIGVVLSQPDPKKWVGKRRNVGHRYGACHKAFDAKVRKIGLRNVQYERARVLLCICTSLLDFMAIYTCTQGHHSSR